MSVVRTYCTVCGVGCPAAVTLDGDRVVSVEPDREHQQGGAFCAKGRAAPEIHTSLQRIDHPLMRTAPKGAADPGWRRATWNEALGTVAAKLRSIKDESGPRAVAFGRGTGSGTGLSPAEPWVQRLAAHYGSPNYLTNTHLCQWPRDGVAHHTDGVFPMPMPEVARSGAVLLWGHNPAATLLSLATEVVEARKRGVKLVVVDPRIVGLAAKADLVLQVRPGTDGALALAFVDVLITQRRYDDAFVRRWTNAPLLVREDDGRLLRAEDLAHSAIVEGAGPPTRFVATDGRRAIEYVPSTGRYAAEPALDAELTVELRDGGRVRCRTVFALLRETAAACGPARAAQITGVPEERIRAAVDLLVSNRPVSHYLWNGVVQHTNATQTCRAIEIFYALLGDFDRAGGNVVMGQARTRDIANASALSAEASRARLGLDERPLGPPAAPVGNVTAYDVFDAILDADPYRVRAVIAFGGNMLMNSGDTLRARGARAARVLRAGRSVPHADHRVRGCAAAGHVVPRGGHAGDPERGGPAPRARRAAGG